MFYLGGDVVEISPSGPEALLTGASHLGSPSDLNGSSEGM